MGLPSPRQDRNPITSCCLRRFCVPRAVFVCFLSFCFRPPVGVFLRFDCYCVCPLLLLLLSNVEADCGQPKVVSTVEILYRGKYRTAGSGGDWEALLRSGVKKWCECYKQHTAHIQRVDICSDKEDCCAVVVLKIVPQNGTRH